MIPTAFENRMKIQLEEEYPAFIASFQAPAFHALRRNPLKKNHMATGLPFGKPLEPVPWCDTGYYYDEDLRPGRHPYHEAGVYYIQEPSAMAPAEYLDVKPGDTVLDLCAAPGGKSTQIAGKMAGKGLLISNEIIPSRAKILSENIERMGIRNAIVTNESPEKLASVFHGFFDRIMVDAPCSGEGMFRKNSAACEEWSPDHVILCASRQQKILEEAATMLKPNGRIVYSTCTFSIIENEGTILHFLQNHPEFHLVPTEKKEGMEDGIHTPSLFQNILTEEEIKSYEQISSLSFTIRMMPHHLKGEGHFIAVLEKSDGSSGKSKTIKPASPLLLKEYDLFAKDFFKVRPEGKTILFGSNLYLVPENCPPLDSLKVLRPGLHLGSLFKNRFEPSHSLALAMSSEDVKNVMPLSLLTGPEENDHEQIYRYLNGETLSFDGPKGWYLITVDGYSIGLGKLSSGIMKNHYPKGLRKNIKND